MKYSSPLQIVEVEKFAFNHGFHPLPFDTSQSIRLSSESKLLIFNKKSLKRFIV